ncbi:MAG: hypothetical protein QXJ31_05520 [Candidatus Bathyarchaeia archaeon]
MIMLMDIVKRLSIGCLFLMVAFFPLVETASNFPENEPCLVKFKYVNGQWFVDDEILKLVTPLHFEGPIIPIRIVDLGNFFKVLEEEKTQPVQIKMKAEGPFPSNITLEFKGEKAVLIPEIIKIEIPINGTILLGYAYRYGPYGGGCLIGIQISVTWTPDDQVLYIVCYDATTGEGRLHRATDGHGFVIFDTNPTREYYVLIGNPSEENIEAITYSGIITLYYRP